MPTPDTDLTPAEREALEKAYYQWCDIPMPLTGDADGVAELVTAALRAVPRLAGEGELLWPWTAGWYDSDGKIETVERFFADRETAEDYASYLNLTDWFVVRLVPAYVGAKKGSAE